MICDRPDMGPKEILSTGPRVRRDATERTVVARIAWSRVVHAITCAGMQWVKPT